MTAGYVRVSSSWLALREPADAEAMAGPHAEPAETERPAPAVPDDEDVDFAEPRSDGPGPTSTGG